MKLSFKILTTIFLTILLGVVRGECQMQSFTLAPVETTFFQGEPIQLIMQFANYTQDSMEVQLGAGGIGHIQVVVLNEEHEKELVSGKPPSGFVINETLRIQPGDSVIHILVLDDLVILTETGEYTIEVHVGEKRPLVAETVIHIIPAVGDNAARTLEEKCAEWWEAGILPDGSIGNQRSLRLLCLTRHKAALKYQLRLLNRGLYVVGIDNLNTLLRSMLGTHSPLVMEALVSVLQKYEKKSPVRSMVLYHLRSAIHDKEWDKTALRALDPYREEIEKATPIYISD